MYNLVIAILFGVSSLFSPIQTQLVSNSSYVTEDTIINYQLQAEKHEVMILDFGVAGGLCTGAILNNDTGSVAVLTAKHCIGPQPQIYVEGILVHKIEMSQTYDLALLYLDNIVLDKTASILATTDAVKNEEIFGVGYPTVQGFPMYGIMSFGIDHNHYAKMELIKGCSGGGLYNKQDELVGIVWGYNRVGLGIYTPISYIKDFLSDINYGIK